jgi:hypothetical protein
MIVTKSPIFLEQPGSPGGEAIFLSLRIGLLNPDIPVFFQEIEVGTTIISTI